MFLTLDTFSYLWISLFFTVISIILFFLHFFPIRIKKEKDSPLIKLSKGWSMLAYLISVFFMNYSYQVNADKHTVGASSVFYNLINTFQSFTYGLNYGLVTETLSKAISRNNCWKLYIALILLLSPIIGGASFITLVASFFPEIKSALSFGFWKLLKKDIWVFSALNEQSIALATDLENHTTKKPLIVFGNCKLDSEDSEYEGFLSRADSRGYICLKRDLSTIHFWRKHSLTYYFVSNDDIVNLDSATYMADKGLPCWDNCQETTEMNVFAQSDLAKNILEEIIHHNKKPHSIRIIPYITNTIYYQFLKHPLFLCEHPYGELTVSIIGNNDWAVEFFKTILWYGQIPNVKLHINCYTKEESFYEVKLKHLISELEDFREESTSGKPYCDWKISKYDLATILSDKTTDVWFVCSENEQNNIQTAFSICRNAKKQIEVFYQVRSNNISDAMMYSNKIALSYNCKMHAFGALSEQYSYNNIEGCLYLLADGFEKSWKNPAKEHTFEIEYKRRSSLAEALHLIYKLYHYGFLTEDEILNTDNLGELIRKRLNENWTKEHQEREATNIGRMEHIRWIAYMRSIGYSCCTIDELLLHNPPQNGQPIDTKNHFLKKHMAMVPYSSLRKESKKLKKRGTHRNLQYQTDYSVMMLKKALEKEGTIQEFNIERDIDDYERAIIDEEDREI